MCRSVSEGGRRCSGGARSAGRPASTARVWAGSPGRADGDPSSVVPAVSWAVADREFSAAVAAVEGKPYGSTVASDLLTGVLSRRAQHAARGGDLADYDSEVVSARQLVHGLLTGRGDDADTAARKVADLEAAHAVWLATPEKRSR